MRMTVLSYGLGADSTAILLKFLADPSAYGLREDLSDLCVVHSVTGNEWPDSLDYVARHVLPLLRERGVRLVQVARGGHLEADGIVVLSDTRKPYRIRARGPWVLSQDLTAAGTVPTLAKGKRTCSANAKGSVLDRWSAAEFGTTPFRRVIGYHYGELRRADEDTRIQRQRNRDAGRTICDPYYPLIEERMDRAQVEAYVQGRCGEPIKKSYCTICCFSGICASREDHEERLRAFPHLAADALRLEYTAMALNENSSLYGTTSLYRNLTEDARNEQILRAFETSLDQAHFALYEVRRVYFAKRTPDCLARHGKSCRSPQWWCRHERTDHCRLTHSEVDGEPACDGGGLCASPARKGTAWRSVRSVLEGDREATEAAVSRFAHEHEARLERGKLSGIQRAHYCNPGDSYPHGTGFLVAAPIGAEDKQRGGFETAWTNVTGRYGTLLTPLRPLGNVPEQLDLSA